MPLISFDSHVSVRPILPLDVEDAEGIALDAARQVRQVVRQHCEALWRKLRSELQTQKLIWESVSIVQSEADKAKVENLRNILETAMVASDRDREAAIVRLGVATQGNDKERLLSDSFLTALQSASGSQRARTHCEDLALLLESQPAYMIDKKGLESQLSACNISDPALEQSLRQVLNLPLPGFGRMARSASVPNAASPQRASSGSRRKFGTPCNTGTSSGYPPEGHMRPIQSRGIQSAPVVMQRKRSNGHGVLRESTSTTMGRENTSTSTVLGREGTGTSIAVEPSSRPSDLARKVRSIATKRVSKAYEKVTTEVHVQKLVWRSSSLALSPEEQKRLTLFDSALEKALNGAPEKSWQGVQTILAQCNAEGHDVLRALSDAVLNVRRQRDARQPRKDLAERLATAEVAASLPHTDSEVKALERIVVAADLDDLRLERLVRSALLLPPPAEPTKVSDQSSPKTGLVPGKTLSGRIRHPADDAQGRCEHVDYI
mmetsp:Transcript_12527/g.27956  ORF Transcript_12527/g.27956 Transcript_12527/m.27956 type:complete len:491 (-) Transcript_12527:40-1512(-)